MKGWPDYVRTTGLVENYDEFAQNYPVGIGDGAARLGSIKTFDMRGRVIFIDDFEAAVLKWGTSSAGVGGSQALDTAQARSGNQSCRLTSNTGVGRHSRLQRDFPPPLKKRIGLEVSISTEPTFGEIEIEFYLYDGVDGTIAMLQVLEATQVINYLNAAGGWTNTGFAWGPFGYPKLFQTFKLVQNWQTNEWIRIMYNNQELNMQGIPCHIFGPPQPTRMSVQIDAVGDNVNNTNSYVDDVIITAMEPE